MIRSLRKRPRADALKSEQRRVTNRTGRFVYLAMMIALIATGANFLFGDLVFLRADGLVLRNKTTVSTTYLARVESVGVSPGDRIAKGLPILTLQSTDILERLAELSSKRASLAARAADFRIRLATASSLLPFAEMREEESQKMLTKLGELANRQIIGLARYNDALRARFDAKQSFIEIGAQNDALKEELASVDAARADAENALAKLRNHYADGVVRAPVDGAVGTTVPAKGDVYRPGETILEVYSGKPYVLVYLPRRYLFEVQTGAAVMVTSGRLSAAGRITDILPVTAALPKEFQNSFKPSDRSQLARISFHQEPPFPLHAKVSLRLADNWF